MDADQVAIVDANGANLRYTTARLLEDVWRPQGWRQASEVTTPTPTPTQVPADLLSAAEAAWKAQE